jgi:hypothetical protein
VDAYVKDEFKFTQSYINFHVKLDVCVCVYVLWSHSNYNVPMHYGMCSVLVCEITIKACNQSLVQQLQGISLCLVIQ